MALAPQAVTTVSAEEPKSQYRMERAAMSDAQIILEQKRQVETAYERVAELKKDAREMKVRGKNNPEAEKLLIDLDELQSDLEKALEDLESQDKLGNFEIQDLMSRFNQAETLASSVQKKTDDTKNAVIGKV